MENIYNTEGAAKYLGCTKDNIHQRARKGKLKAHKYNADGLLVPLEKGDSHRGQGLYFFQSDLDEYQRTKKLGRPLGSKEKKRLKACKKIRCYGILCHR